MAIQTLSFTQIVSNTVAAIQGAASQLVDLTVGSILRAYTEAIALITLWLQGIALQIASLTRFATSSGPDADSWAADFGFARLPAQAAEGDVTFSRFTATAQATIPVGTVVQTADGSQKYQVIADTTQTAYNAGLNAYVLPAMTSSCTATIQALTAGAAANVQAGLINTLGAAISGVDTVTNAAAFTTGADAQSDSAFRVAFIAYLLTLSKATKAAIINAAESVQQGITCTFTENYNYAGTYTLGYFYLVVDDGTGSPSGGLLSTISNAVDLVRPVGSTFGIFAPSLETANVAMTITTATGYSHPTIVSLVQTALQTYINGLGIGVSLPFTQLATVAYGASPAVTNVTGVTLNSGTADLAATNKQAIRAGTLSVT